MKSVPCKKCGRPVCSKDDHMILVAPGGRLVNGLKPFCRDCYWGMTAGGRARWFEAMATRPRARVVTLHLSVGGRHWEKTVHMPEAIESFPEFSNLGTVLEAMRQATERNPWTPVLRGYNRLGRCVLWVP